MLMLILQVQEEFTEDNFKSIYIPIIIKSRRIPSDGFFLNFVTLIEKLNEMKENLSINLKNTSKFISFEEISCPCTTICKTSRYS